MTNFADEVATRFETTPLHPEFGIVVHGFDFSAPTDQSQIDEIKALADRHFLLLFRGQGRLSEEQHMRFSRAFGPLIPPVEAQFASTTEPMILHLGNVDNDGNKVADEDPKVAYTYAPEKWHSDGSYKPVTNYLSILHGLVIPPEGGETWFASMNAAYSALPDAMKAKIDNMSMEHPYPNRKVRMKGWTGPNIEVVSHPMVRQLPDGQKTLYLSPFGGRVHGLSEEEGDTLVRELFDYVTSGAFTYAHQWQQYDTLIWNNRGLVHMARPWDRVKHCRLMQRTEIAS